MRFDVSNLAIQSWCLREFKDNKLVASMVRDLGLSGIELCGVHCDFNKPETFDGVIEVYKNAGLRIVSIGVEGFGADEAAARHRFEFAKKAGCQIISANFAPSTFMAALPIVGKLFKEYGIQLAIHNHGGYHWLGNADMLGYVFSFTQCCIGLNMDTAWALDARQDPVKWADRFADRLRALHLKDFTFDKAGRGHDVVVGEGNLNLPALFDKLREKGFKGELIVEYEAEPENPVPALKNCIASIRKVAAG